MRILAAALLLVFQSHAQALSCGGYDETYFAKQENLGVITILSAELIEQPQAQVLVSFKTDEILAGDMPKKGQFSFERNNDRWPTRIDIGQKYIVPFPESGINWGVCSQALYRFETCTVYGIKKIIDPKTEKNAECHRRLLLRKAMNLTRPETPEQMVQLHRLSDEELQLLVDEKSDTKET